MIARSHGNRERYPSRRHNCAREAIFDPDRDANTESDEVKCEIAGEPAGLASATAQLRTSFAAFFDGCPINPLLAISSPSRN